MLRSYHSIIEKWYDNEQKQKIRLLKLKNLIVNLTKINDYHQLKTRHN